MNTNNYINKPIDTGFTTNRVISHIGNGLCNKNVSRSIKQIFQFSTLLVLFLLFNSQTLIAQSKTWVGTWSCACYAAGSNNTPPSPFLANNTLRQVVRVSIGGDTIRVKFSNKTCSTPVTMKSVKIATSIGTSSIDTSTLTQLKFDGDSSVTMNAYSSVISDPIAFPLEPSMHVAITIYYGEAASNADICSHVASRTDSYIAIGNKSSATDFSGATITAHWFHINTIEVQAADTAACIGIIGNSITDGYGLHGGLQNRWTDHFSQALLNDNRTKHIGVLNLGIGATSVSGSSATAAINRYKDDLLNQSGIRWIIVFHGTNDIAGNASAAKITNAYQAIINDAHAMKIKIYGATITPFKGSGHYSEAHEKVRNTVNEWIRTPGNFDACIDFDKAIRDPNNSAKLTPEFSNDWLHPNANGYEFLGKSINLNLFTELVSNKTLFASAGSDQTVIDLGNKGSTSVQLNGTRSVSRGSAISSYVWSEDDKQITSGDLTNVKLPVGTHKITLTITDANGNIDSDKVSVTIIKESGVWLEAECGKIGTLWNIKADKNASNGKYVTVKAGNNSNDKAPTDSISLLTYTFNIEESGTYNLYARIICPSANDDSFWIKMNDGSFAMWNNIATSEWQWVKFSSGYNLSKGNHTLTIGYREDGAKLDKLWITKNGASLFDKGTAAGNCSTSSIIYRHTPDTELYPNPIRNELNICMEIIPIEVKAQNINDIKIIPIAFNKTFIRINKQPIN